jgi:5'-methylthioadenosine phosphorylase
MAQIGIIGGSGLYSLIKGGKSLEMETPYGKPSDKIEIGEIDGIEVAFIPRHGKKHSFPPHMVNYRANLWALKKIGVERILAINAVGSLKEEFKPGDMVFPDQFIDFTKSRKLTFFDGPDVYHVSAADPFCPDMTAELVTSAKKSGYDYHASGTYVCIEGPRFSTRAESRMFRQFGDIIGMTLVPEINLAIEQSMCYSMIATVTDFDVWSDKPVDASEVMKIMKENEEKVSSLVEHSVRGFSRKRNCNCSRSLENARA